MLEATALRDPRGALDSFFPPRASREAIRSAVVGTSDR
jgi:hypothetical protein